ncbi:hypothetical protein [Pengzhenrongella frigida]|uniref:Uncharacterized protein n=1 Tax=Pengzhenrongella frigida TaxID=1259133 RepID=A0A4Q5N5F8_9MICO|nr:hypothetical protein [Cellulomonas sp. HLT2-17]RYV52057.1 hypothetical protein EUA98_05690 [Cellulomonas sp. HLT2-17]
MGIPGVLSNLIPDGPDWIGRAIRDIERTAMEDRAAVAQSFGPVMTNLAEKQAALEAQQVALAAQDVVILAQTEALAAQDVKILELIAAQVGADGQTVGLLGDSIGAVWADYVITSHTAPSWAAKALRVRMS